MHQGGEVGERDDRIGSRGTLAGELFERLRDIALKDRVQEIDDTGRSASPSMSRTASAAISSPQSAMA